jgi:outer membrane protein TolC
VRVNSPGRLHAAAARGTLATLCLALQCAWGQTPAPLRADAAPALQLDAATMVRMTVERNAEIVYNKLQADIASLGVDAQAALYEPTLFATLRREDRDRPRTVEERLTTPLSNVGRLDEKVHFYEGGLRQKTPSGADVSTSVRVNDKNNNLIASTRPDKDGQETAGALVVTLRQPLLRGAGRSVVETDLKVAELDRSATIWQYKQQILRVGGDALAAYWNLQRAKAMRGVRAVALENANELLRDVKVRSDGGRLAPNTVTEARSAVIAREAEVYRAAGTVSEAEAKVRTVLNLPPFGAPLNLPPMAEAAGPKDAGDPVARFDRALEAWPSYRIAELRLQQNVVRLAFASNQKQPQLDFLFSWSSNSLVRGRREAYDQILPKKNLDYYFGVSFEKPIGGNQAANARYDAQAVRVQQSQLEMQAVQNALGNDIASRTEQFQQAAAELEGARIDSQLRQELLDSERDHFKAGLTPLAQVLRREGEQIEAQLRIVEVQVRLELARAALMTADGSLLTDFQIEVGY